MKHLGAVATVLVACALVGLASWVARGCQDGRKLIAAYRYADSVRADTARFTREQRAFEDSITPILDTAHKIIARTDTQTKQIQRRVAALDRKQAFLDSAVAALGDTTAPVPRSVYDQQKFQFVQARLEFDSLAHVKDDLEETAKSLLSGDSLRQTQLRHSYRRIAALESAVDSLDNARDCLVDVRGIVRWCPSSTVAFATGAGAVVLPFVVKAVVNAFRKDR
jgi:hypothetical protein